MNKIANLTLKESVILIKIVLLLIFMLSVISCSSTPDINATRLNSDKINLNNTREVKARLYDMHDEWEGVDYEMGGLSKDGIDCSGFVYATFRSKLGIDIPRSTELQIKTGKKISRKNLRTGDLIFFKTSEKVRHVGIYLGNNKFLHASTSEGVIISELDNVYWKSKFLLAKRL
ncbi:MAG: NlpC/P60 family protein [Gammaproteobacteria bacterium]|nr:NlpC/P60 family protein [Gammaproteobacteria bacterium]